MLKAISISENTKEQIKDLIFKLSPYSEITLDKFNTLVDKFLGDDKYQHIEVIGHEDTRTTPGYTYQKYFLLWRSYDKTKIYAGQAFITEQEVQNGLNMRRLEYYTS